jgi:hypothetical protein
VITAADEWRYAYVSRPWIKTVKVKRPERIEDAYERAHSVSTLAAMRLCHLGSESSLA